MTPTYFCHFFPLMNKDGYTTNICLFSCLVLKWKSNSHLYFHFYCEMTAHEEKRRVLKENRLFLSRLLQENNAPKFQQLLYEHPNYIHMHCNEYDGVSFWLILLFILCCVNLYLNIVEIVVGRRWSDLTSFGRRVRFNWSYWSLVSIWCWCQY